ncbi:STAM-binding protein-like A [Babylonia areolata]|uniref:STAM-binding protein-like A n=1 Tax=Babylonia areolata TaxID=304850 RepID=UPI003FD5B90B
MATSAFSHIHDPAEKVRALADYGSHVDVDKLISPKLYFRSGREMLRMANMYCDDGNLESAFILYSKFITLFVERLPSHPEYKSSPPSDIQDFKRKVKKVFPLAEEIKSKLKKRYTEEEAKRQAEEKKRQEQLAKEEEERRKKAEAQMQEDEALARKLQSEAEQQWMQEQEEKYKRLQQQEEERLAAENKRKEDQASSSKDGSVLLIPADVSGFVPTGEATSAGAATAMGQSATFPSLPDRELKKNLYISDQGGTSIDDIPSVPPPAYSPPIPDRSTKPADHFMSTGLFGGSGGLRDVIVPADLIQKFIIAAQSNTVRKTETMGILCGKVSGNAFKITNLFIPQQTGTPDSCDMQNEEDLIMYQDKHDLITLGWIHTHPTQTAFLSSVDMHTHFAYQKMLPEAVAIVCSPKFQETGLFSLTDLGLDVIGRCREKSFHYHAKEPPLFETSAHAKVVSTVSATLTDLRK